MRRPFSLQLFGQEKTEPATPQKRRKTREEGKTAKSQDLGAAVVILAGLIFMKVFAGYLGGGMREHLLFMLRAFGDPAFSGEGWSRLLGARALTDYLYLWLPLAVACALAALAITVYQVGFFMSSKPLELKLDRLNPLSGLKRIFSIRSLVELFKGLLKASLLMLLLYYALKKDLDRIVAVIRLPLDEGMAIVAETVWFLGLRFALLLLAIALFDYLYQRWEFERSIKMSKQEIKDEYKQMEGDPLIKRRIRQKQRELARGRMMQAVPKADVVITNPTMLAVALLYERKSMDSPQVVAKGQGVIARRIREIAVENDVPIVENKILARALYSQVEIGMEVPEELYRAVAEVLAFVYRLRDGRKGASARSVS